MNTKRRGRLKDALNLLSSASDILTSVCDKEQDCLDNYPENLQGTDRYERMESAVDNLNDALEKLEDIKDCIASAIG